VAGCVTHVSALLHVDRFNVTRDTTPNRHTTVKITIMS
jgi:hypothetical protein